MSAVTEFKPKFWTPGGWNAFFGSGADILLNTGCGRLARISSRSRKNPRPDFFITRGDV
jgi:hypothetical protein